MSGWGLWIHCELLRQSGLREPCCLRTLSADFFDKTLCVNFSIDARTPSGNKSRDSFTAVENLRYSASLCGRIFWECLGVIFDSLSCRESCSVLFILSLFSSSYGHCFVCFNSLVSWSSLFIHEFWSFSIASNFSLNSCSLHWGYLRWNGSNWCLTFCSPEQIAPAGSLTLTFHRGTSGGCAYPNRFHKVVFVREIRNQWNMM